MRRLAVIVAIALMAGTALADEPITSNQNFQGHFVYGIGPPGSSPAPSTSAVTPRDLNPAGAPCILQAPGSNGLPVCATPLTSLSVTDPISSTGGPTPTLGLKFDNATITLNGGGAIQTGAMTGAIAKAPGATLTTFGTQAGNSFLGVAGSSSGAPAAISCPTPGTFAGNVGGTLSCTATIPASSVPLAAGAVGFGSAGNLLTGDAANFHWDGTNDRLGIRVAAPVSELHLVDEAASSDRGMTLGEHNAATAGQSVIWQKSYGTYASPAAVDASAYLGRFAFSPYDGIGYLRTMEIVGHVIPGATVATNSVPTEIFIGGSNAGISDPYGGSGVRGLRITSPGQVGFFMNTLAAFPTGFQFVAPGSGVLFGSPSGGTSSSTYNPYNFGASGVHFNGNSQSLFMSNSNTRTPGAGTTLFHFASSRGTNASPLAVAGGDQINGSGFYGWDGTTFTQGTATTAFVDFNSTVSSGHVPMNWAVFSGDGSGLPGLFHGYADDVVAGNWSQLATSSTQGFFWAAAVPGVPTGVPVVPQISSAGAAITTAIPLAPDAVHDRLYAYFGHWAPVGQDTTALSAGFLKNTATTGVWTVDTTSYVPASLSVQGTAPIAIAGDHAAHDLSTNRVWSVDANGVTDALFRQSGPLAVVGRSANSTGNTGDIQATAGSGGVLRESGSTLGFGAITEGIVTNLLTDLSGKVPTARTLTMTAPMTCDGTGSCDLSANRTIATPVFAGSTAGLVPSSGGGTTTFLRADGAFAAPSAVGADALGTYWVSSSTHAPVNAVNFGSQPSGILEIAVSGSTATPSAFAATTSEILYGGSGGGLAQSSAFQFDGSQMLIANATVGHVSISLDDSSDQAIDKGGAGDLLVGTSINGAVHFYTFGAHRFDIGASGQFHFFATNDVTFNSTSSPIAATPPSAAEWDMTPLATAMAASLGAIYQWDSPSLTVTGATTNTSWKGAYYFGAPTLTNATSSTMLIAPTVRISGAPSCTGSLTCTEKDALWVESGPVRLDGTLVLPALSAGGILKTIAANGSVALASAGTDYQAPLTFLTGLTNASGTITADLSTGKSGGQLVIGGTTTGGLGILSNTSHNSTIGFGNGSSIGVMDEGTGKQSWGQTGVDAFAHFVTTSDTTPLTLTAWDGRHVFIGGSGSGAAGIGFSHDGSSGSGHMFFVHPNAAWENADFHALTFNFFSSGSTLGFSQDSGGSDYVATLSAGGLVKTAPSTGGQLALATAADVSAALGLGSSNGIVKVSSGTPGIVTANGGLQYSDPSLFISGTNVSRIGWTDTSFPVFMTAPTAMEWDITPGSASVSSSMPAVYQWDAITETRAGTGHTTSDNGFMYLPQITITDASASTVDKVATLTIENGPQCAGSMTCTATPAMWVKAGNAEFDGPALFPNLAGGPRNMPTMIDNTGELLTPNVGVVNWAYTELIQWSGSVNGTLPISTLGTLASVAEGPTNYGSAQARLTCNLLSNTITGGSLVLSLSRNGTLVSGTFVTWTSSSTPGVYTQTLITGSSSASDTYGLHYQTSGGANASMSFACQLSFN